MNREQAVYDLYDKWVEERISDLRNYPFRDIIHEVTEDTLNFSRINLKRIFEEVDKLEELSEKTLKEVDYGLRSTEL